MTAGIRTLRFRIRQLVQDLRTISETIDRHGGVEVYHPGDEPRKTRRRILWEMVRWRLQHRQMPTLYFACGLDRKGMGTDALVAHRRLIELRDAGNYSPTTWRRFNYIAVLRDKHLFQLFAAAHDHPIPKTIARLDRMTVRWTDDPGVGSLDDIVLRGTLDGFAKPVVGIWGMGAFRLRVEAGRLTIDDVPASVDDLRHRLQRPYLLQQRIVQHVDFAALHPASINTLRLVTVIEGDRPSLLSAAVRVGVRGKPVDNWGSGGLIIGVDRHARCLRGRGFFKPGMGGSVACHPDTGIAFEGYRVPQIGESIEVVTRFHHDLPTIRSIGWDVALTPDGPLVIEANDHWNVAVHLLTDPEFANRALRVLEVPASIHRPAEMPWR